ncbi:hypothetical protein RBK84_00450, partial [Pseudomonas aeruginosa]|uniref:hypothetical protein n=1 Tax=Pseudomonas aeruginosa TaxID=287 RepID=UPI0027D41241
KHEVKLVQGKRYVHSGLQSREELFYSTKKQYKIVNVMARAGTRTKSGHYKNYSQQSKGI